jgi:hypothetical protein
VTVSPGSGKSHLAQAIGQAVIQQGYRVLYRETHTLLDELTEATIDGSRKEFIESVVAWPFLIIDDLGMRKLPLTAAEDHWRSSCGAMNALVLWSLPIGQWKTGANCWVMQPP